MFKFKSGIFEPKVLEKYVTDTFFGGAEKKAAKAQTKALEKAQEYTREAAAQARGDLFKLYPAAQQNANQGFQAAMDIFGQSVPAQMNAFQGGNVAAQQQLLAGLPQMNNALLGAPIDYSQFQTYQAPQQDYSFLQQQLPAFVDPYAPIDQPYVKPDIGSLLGGETGSNRFFNQSDSPFYRLNLR